MRNLSLQRGIGLLELMLSIIVITAIILGATKYYLGAKEEMRITQAIEIINNVAEAAYKWVEQYSDFSGLTGGTGIKPLIDAGLLPQSYGGDKISPWGGKLIITKPGASDPGTVADLRVGFAGLGDKTSNSCKRLRNKYKVCPSHGEELPLPTCLDDNCTFYFRSP